MEDFLLKYIQLRFYKFVSFIFGVVLLFLFFNLIDNFLLKFISNNNDRLKIYLFITICWAVYWLYFRYYLRKNKKNKIGLVIAIKVESRREESRLKNDFISKLRENVNKEEFGKLINIIVLKNHVAEKMQGKDAICKLHKKLKGHFYIWGSIKRRKDGANKYFLNLNGMVVHSPINIRASKALSNEFTGILPKEISFLEDLELRGFEFAADIVYLASRYVTGIAAFISGYTLIAYNFHNNLYGEFNKFRPLPENLQRIRNRIPILISNEALLLARYNYNNNNIAEMENWINTALQSNVNNYGVWLLKAIYQFKIVNDPIGALDCLKKARKNAHYTFEWRYSRAFLLFWLEKYTEALKDCNYLAKNNYQNESITTEEVENFTLEQLLTHKKPQLYFWLGFINYRKRFNFPKSLKYFEEFERNANDLSFNILKQKSQVYLSQIKQKMKIS
ncbi:MAG: hypothetical protein A2Y82_01565 [Candidatus Buchananbacteria bacterium RBG_13_36_9]|uniref:Uncharacterized protein n=1 Tax=Candidatus Buchananbacteria bacterium RBG_13_36_9 TaxID=1797530 RepID=A0A1G1XN46_9BACT|nr:MAG: hypothetical protein A2Y82_01565 [Candidatus Buchananbacteria bacterium RBG_13_36_9]